MTAAKRLSEAIFYLDESINSRILAQSLQSAGVSIRLPGIDISRGTIDAAWLATCGSNGWIVLMRDKRVRRRPLELHSLMTSGVAAFVLTAGEATAQDTADTISRIVQKMVNIAVSETRPFLYTFGLAGSLSRVPIRRRH